MKTSKSPYSKKANTVSPGEATALFQLSECAQVAKALFVELVNMQADQRRDWGTDQTFGSDMHFLLLRKFGIHHFTDDEMNEIHRIVRANSPGKTDEEIKYTCRFVAYNQFLEYLVDKAARLDQDGKLVFRAVTTEYVSPYANDKK